MGRKIGKIVVVLSIIFLLNGLGSLAEEQVEMYRISCEEPSGQNGYYTKSVKVEIEHFDEKCQTRFQLFFPDGRELSGDLKKAGDKAVLEEDLFEKGTYTLSVWMENEDGKVIEGTEQKREFKIDKEAPKEPIAFQYSGEESSNQIVSNEEITVHMKASDDISGIQGIYYQKNEEEIQFLEGESGNITIPVGFEGKICAYAVDMAGNKGEMIQSKMIVCENGNPEILMSAPNGFGKWYNEPCQIQIEVKESGITSGMKQVTCSVEGVILEQREYEYRERNTDRITLSVDKLAEVVVEVCDWAGNVARERQQILFDNERPQMAIDHDKNYVITAENQEISCIVKDNQRVEAVSGKIVWDNARGERTERAIENWKKDGEQYLMKEELTETGKYEIYFEATDPAGNKSEEHMQIMIDKEKPLIHKMEEINGKYIPFFEWEYEVSEIVEDFTTYSYRINMDGRMCEQNKRYTKEGRHLLELIVEDSAGNISRAKSEFFIDHTLPEIQIQSLKEKRRVDVVLQEETDFIDAVFINEKRQEVGKNAREFSKVFQEDGTYEVLVLAKDFAGNQSEKKETFEVKTEKSFFTSLVKPKNNVEKKEKVEVKKKRENNEAVIFIILIGVGAILIGAGYKKIAHKREDAG